MEGTTAVATKGLPPGIWRGRRTLTQSSVKAIPGPETANGCLDLQSAETTAERHNCELRRRSDILPRFSPGRQKSVANNLPGEHC